LIATGYERKAANAQETMTGNGWHGKWDSPQKSGFYATNIIKEKFEPGA
jgi:hypothetical protein